MKRALTSLEELKSDKCPNKSKRLRLINEAAEEFGRAIHKAKEDLEGMKMKLSQTQKATKHLKQILHQPVQGGRARCGGTSVAAGDSREASRFGGGDSCGHEEA